VELGSEDSDFLGVDLGLRVTQDLSLTLIGIWKEMSIQLDIMQQMLQVSMAQLKVLWVRGVDLVSQAEAVCQVRSGQSVVRTQEARSRSERLQEMELRGCAIEALEQSQGLSGSGEIQNQAQSRVQVKGQKILQDNFSPDEHYFSLKMSKKSEISAMTNG